MTLQQNLCALWGCRAPGRYETLRVKYGDLGVDICQECAEILGISEEDELPPHASEIVSEFIYGEEDNG